MGMVSMSAKRVQALCATSEFGVYSSKPIELLKNAGIELDLNPFRRKLSESEVKSLLSKKNYVGLLAGLEPLTSDVLSNSKVKVVSRVGVGVDNVDLKAAEGLGIRVYNTPNVLTQSVAELTLGLMLCALRGISLSDRKLRKKIWERHMGSLLDGKVVGIIGFGAIGQRVGALVKAFGAEVIFYDTRKIDSWAPHVGLSELLARSDIITVHASGKESIIGEDEIGKMKDGVILINAARGNLIEEEALIKALMNGKVAWAALDVFKEEPYEGKLAEIDNVTLTSHIGSYAKEARIEMEIKAAENLIKGLKEVGLI
jgi:D-3-phosphoglycerate dehydrogenase